MPMRPQGPQLFPMAPPTSTVVVSESSTSSPAIHSTVNMASLLSSLNPAQLRAVKHDPSIPLQILAGPGSGKTKVLISRIAQLILTHKISPSYICAVTFTNKAANEMRDRLNKLLGKSRTNALQMGTFHSLCAKFLRQYSHKVSLEPNFTICDADESKKLIGALLKPYKDYLIEHDLTVTEAFVASIISKAKAKGQSAAMFFQDTVAAAKSIKVSRNKSSTQPASEETKSMERIVAEVYNGYEQVLKHNNALDFDDLLVYGVALFTKYNEAVLWCRHILVDEFQDTNTMQYELMRVLAMRRCVTIVGDPDQSIYGWRSAEVENLARMRADFPETQQIFLEQNYRSTAAILRSSLAIVAEDKKRIPKSLHTTHPLGATPLVREFDSEKDEAWFIAFEIKRCVANMGGVLRWGDFVVLLRFNALSRPIESALQLEGIPCRILGGHKFFERMEVKDILSYLQLVDNPDFNPAFARAIKVPARGTGDKTLAEIASHAESLKISQLHLVERIHDNKIPDIKPPIKRKITSFVKIIRTLRKLDEEDTPPAEMIRELVTMLGYEDYLKKTQQDWESRWENVQELITFASEVETEAPPVQNSKDSVAESSTVTRDSVLRQFLQASMLSSEGDNLSEEESKEKVTISTCHAAKGLEWPVVMIPSVDQDTFPFYRTEDIEEERRLLYVACTRAQSLLYVLHSKQRQVAGKTKQKRLSDFISVVRGKNDALFSYDIPRFLTQDRAVISEVLSRPPADETEVERMLAELKSSGARMQSAFQGTNGRFSAVTLTGVKYAVEEEAPLYAAPDVLAALSETFMKDYKKPAFRKASRLGSSSVGTSFASASSVARTPSTPSSLGGSSLSNTEHSDVSPRFQAVESLLQGVSNSRNTQTSARQSLSHPTYERSWPSSTCIPNTFEDKADFIKKPRSNYTQPVRPTSLASESTSFTLTSSSAPNPTRQPGHPLAPNGVRNGKHHSSAYTHSSQHSGSENSHGSTSFPNPSNRLASTAQSSGQLAKNPIYSLPRASDNHAPRTVCSSLLQTPRALQDKKIPPVNYDTNTVEGAATTMMLPQYDNPRPNALPREIPDSFNASHAVPQSSPQTAVKRRLGMGRSTTGYSNKKFKPIV